jgi:hypothetical protein
MGHSAVQMTEHHQHLFDRIGADARVPMAASILAARAEVAAELREKAEEACAKSAQNTLTDEARRLASSG